MMMYPVTAIFIATLQSAPTAEQGAPHGTLAFTIVDTSDHNIPARLTFTDTNGAKHEMFPNANADPTKLAVRSHVVYTLDGMGTITVPIGSWDVMASHGIEWSIDETHIDVEEGGAYTWDAVLEHEIDTTGWVSGDFHLHTLTYSGHGDSNMNERIISLVGENVEFAVATDHNYNTDYQPIIDGLGANKHITAVVGNEVSTPYGHLNAFPFDAKAKVVNQKLPAPELFALIRKEQNNSGVVPIIQINHPRWGNIDYFGQLGLDPVTGESDHEGWSWDFDSIEVLNENPGWGYHDAEIADINVRTSMHSVLRDWYNMLNAGRNIAAVGNSDSHTVIANMAGIPRNYVYTGKDDASDIDPKDVTKAIRQGRVTTTTGPFLRMTANGYPMGSTLSVFDPMLDIHLDAQVASWIDLDTIRIIQNGDEVASITFDGQRDGVLHLRPRIRIEIPRDCWIVAIAEGDESMKPYVLHKDRDVYPLAIANPIYIDADGDGKYTPPKAWAENVVLDGNLAAIVELYNEVNSTEKSLLVLAAANNPSVASHMIRLGLSSDKRIIKLAACKAAAKLLDQELLPILAGVVDYPTSDRYLAFSAWMACDMTDSEFGEALLSRYVDRFGWEDAQRYKKERALRLPGDFIRRWQVAGYFALANDDNRLSNLANQKQIPEPNVLQLVVPKTTAGVPLAWVDAESEDDGYLNLSLGAETENTIAYAKCWLWSPDTREVDFAIGSDDACRIWVGNDLVWDDPDWQTARKDRKIGSFILQKGWNPVLFKILNGLKGMGLYFRVLDEEIIHHPDKPTGN